MSYLTFSASFEYLCYGSTAVRSIYIFFKREDRLYKSESDVYRRQILAYKVDPRAERFNSEDV